jgi:DNA repair protein RecN (Recombination protein N)
VLVVTHLAQVAARASTHIVVAKHATDDRTTTTVGALQDAGDRRTEVARLLSGDPDSSVAQEHAAELLDRHGG